MYAFSRGRAQFLQDLTLVAARSPSRPAMQAFRADLSQLSPCTITKSRPVDRASVTSLPALERAFERSRQATRELLCRLPDNDPLLSPVGLFTSMDLGRMETAHSRALAWLLDPRGEHGFGISIISALLEKVGFSHRKEDLGVHWVTAEHPIWSDSNKSGRLDVLASGYKGASGKREGWLLIIEAKIDAEESEHQLREYDRWIEANRVGRETIRLYLTPTGEEPTTNEACWTPLSSLSLASLLRRALHTVESAPGTEFLRLYLAGVFRSICDWDLPVTERTVGLDRIEQYLETAEL